MSMESAAPSPRVATAAQRPERAGGEIAHVTLFVAFLVLLVVATFWVLSPFLTAALWATIVCITAWPLLLRLEAGLGGRGRAVGAMTIALLLVVFVPVTLAVVTVVGKAQDVTDVVRSFQARPLGPPPEWLARIPLWGERLNETWTGLEALDARQRAAALTPYAQTALQWFAGTVGSVGTMLLQFLLTTIISAIGLARGERVRDGMLRFAARLGGQPGYDAAVLAARTIRSVVLGVVGTALIQVAIGGTGLFITGVPAAGLLSAVMLFLCLAQLGPILVLLPAVVWLYWSGNSVQGTILLVVMLIAGGLDNVIRPLLIKRGANLPLLLIFAGVLGGLMAFGIIGLFIGPVVLALGYTLLGSWLWPEQELPSRAV